MISKGNIVRKGMLTSLFSWLPANKNESSATWGLRFGAALLLMSLSGVSAAAYITGTSVNETVSGNQRVVRINFSGNTKYYLYCQYKYSSSSTFATFHTERDYLSSGFCEQPIAIGQTANFRLRWCDKTSTGGAGNCDDSSTSTVQVVANNPPIAPTITNVSNIYLNEGESKTVNFSIADSDTPLADLTVFKSLGQPNFSGGTPTFDLSSSGYTRDFTVEAGEGSYGNVHVSIIVRDKDYKTASTSFEVFVNAAPTISSISPNPINEDTNTGNIVFTVGDDTTAAGDLFVSAVSSNPVLVPNNSSALYLAPSASSTRTIKITPVTNKYGTARITLTVRDQYNAETTKYFDLTVNNVNDKPTISANSTYTIEYGEPELKFNVTIGDQETSPTSLQLTKKSTSNSALIPLSNITLGAGGAVRLITISPTANQIGSSLITIGVTDGEATVEKSFTLTVKGPPLFAGEPVDGVLPISWECSANAYCILKMKPTNVNGWQSEKTINTGTGITNYDIDPGTSYFFELQQWNAGGASSPVNTHSDSLTVNVGNTLPTVIGTFTNRSITVNTSIPTTSYTVADSETPASEVAVVWSSDNAWLLPSGNIVKGGSGKTRTYSINPVANRVGLATITLVVGDSINIFKTFTLTVKPGIPSSIVAPSSDKDGNFEIRWGSAAGAQQYVFEQRKDGGSWVSVYTGEEVIYGATVDPGTYTYRVKACGTDASTNNVVCGDYRTSGSVNVSGSIVNTNRRVIFVHSDLLGSPSAETNEQGNENE